MSVTDGIGQTPCSLEHYLVVQTILQTLLVLYQLTVFAELQTNTVLARR